MGNVQPPKPPNGRARPAKGNGEVAMDPRELLRALNALRKGDFSVRLPVDWSGVGGRVAETFNEVVELNERMATETDRVSRAVAKEGKLSQRVNIGDATGEWARQAAA